MKSIILGTPHIMADLYPANNQILVAKVLQQIKLSLHNKSTPKH